jgi:hypothetical protein
MAGFPSSCELIIKPYFQNIIFIYFLKCLVSGPVSIHSESIEKIQLEISPKRKVPQMPLLGVARLRWNLGLALQAAFCQIMLLKRPRNQIGHELTELPIQNHLWRCFCFFDRICGGSEERAGFANVSELAARTTPAKSAMSATTLHSSP